MPVPNITVQASNANIKTLIGLVKSNLTRYRSYVGEAAIAIMRHTNNFGDCTAALALAKAVNPRDQRSLILFFEAHSPINITINSKDPSKDKVRLSKDPERAEFHFDTAATKNWWEMGKEPKDKTPKALLEFYDGLQSYLKMSDAKLAKFNEADRELVRDAAARVSAIITQQRAKVAEEQQAHTAAAQAMLLGLVNRPSIQAAIRRAA